MNQVVLGDQFHDVVVAIDNNRIRHNKLLTLQATGGRLATLIHPAATISFYARIGSGSVVFAAVALQSHAPIDRTKFRKP